MYAPGEPPTDNSTVKLLGDAKVYGSVVSTTIFIQSDNSYIQWVEGMEKLSIGQDNGTNPIYYLHVSETNIEVTE